MLLTIFLILQGHPQLLKPPFDPNPEDNILLFHIRVAMIPSMQRDFLPNYVAPDYNEYNRYDGSENLLRERSSPK